MHRSPFTDPASCVTLFQEMERLLLLGVRMARVVISLGVLIACWWLPFIYQSLFLKRNKQELDASEHGHIPLDSDPNYAKNDEDPPARLAEDEWDASRKENIEDGIKLDLGTAMSKLLGQTQAQNIVTYQGKHTPSLTLPGAWQERDSGELEDGEFRRKRTEGEDDDGPPTRVNPPPFAISPHPPPLPLIVPLPPLHRIEEDEEAALYNVDEVAVVHTLATMQSANRTGVVLPHRSQSTIDPRILRRLPVTLDPSVAPDRCAIRPLPQRARLQPPPRNRPPTPYPL
ncbi:hypothetical protein C8F01DRAFT_1090465 [Mycena amicta]|nr:hypothetical protein C8F01DRAFT_1090465 [Mycena amicta]